MANFKPVAGQSIEIGNAQYTFVGYEGQSIALKMAYTAEGKRGTVYRLRDSKGINWALKVFKAPYRQQRITTINAQIKEIYRHIEGVTIWERTIIRRPHFATLLDQFPDLEFAVLMPWVEGDNWENYWRDGAENHKLTPEESLRVARQLGTALWQIEQSEVAHCDLAGSNIMVHDARVRVELIDIEDSYFNDITPPSKGDIPAGTDGYYHRTSRKQGQWCPEGDRFAGAILISELLTWHVPEIQAAAGRQATSYFQETDLASPTPHNDRFKLMVDVLKTGSKDIATLVEQAWTAPNLTDCPRLTTWYEALKAAKPTDANSFTMLEVPVLNVVEYLSDNQNEGPLFNWSPVKGAKDYVLEIDTIRDSSVNGNPKLIVCSDNRYASQANASGVFQARVKARSDRRESAWSKPVVFGRLPAPTLSKNVDANEIRLRWTPVAKASHYVVSVIGSGIPQEDKEYQGTECSIDVTAYAPGVYIVFVGAFGTVAGFQGRLVGYASNSINISVPARKPEGLAVSKTGFSAKVTWQPVEYASYYRVTCQPLGKSGFDTITLGVRSPSADFRLPPGAYEFQVVALTEDSIRSTAAICRETVGGLKTPRVTVSEERKKYLVQWDSIDFADKYRLEFERDGKPLEPAETIRRNYTIGSDWEPGTYQVRVQALTKIDDFPEAVSSEPSPPVVVTIRPPRPTWERSKVRVDENTVTLAWNKLLRVTHYRVYYRNTSSNQSEWTETNDTKIRLTLPPATYDFWIVAHYGDITSEKSATRTLALEKPIPIPAWVRASSEEDIIQLEWTPIEGATRYKVEIQGAIPTKVVEWDDTYFERSNPPGAYSIRLATCINELQSQWSEEAIVETKLVTPKILGPYQIELGQNYTVEWTEVPFAYSYQVYDYGFIHPKSQKVPDEPRNKWVSTTTSRTLMGKNLHGRMAFRVVALWRSASGEEHTSASELHIVHVGTAPPLLVIEVPERVTIGETVEISWQPLTSADQYELELAWDEAFTNATLLMCETVKAVVLFDQVGVIFVRVRSKKDDYAGTWSETAKVVIQPERPRSISMLLSGQGTYIQWEPLPNADQYQIDWSVEESFVNDESRTIDTQDNFAVIPFPGFYARVKALNTGVGVEGEWSDTLGLPLYEIGRIETAFVTHEYLYSFREQVIINWRFTDETSEIHEPRFELQIANTEDFVNPTSHEVVEFSATLRLDEVSSYFARVRFLRSTYTYSWSSISRIRVQPVAIQPVEPHLTTAETSPLTPKLRLCGFLKNLLSRPKELQRPVLEVTTSADLIVLHWSTVDSATHYEIQVTAPSGKVPSKKRPVAQGTELRISKAKLLEGVYRCLVIAIDQEADLKSEPSNVVTFQAK